MGSEGRKANNTVREPGERYGDGPIEGNVALNSKFKDKKEGVKMSPKVLETWINENL